MQTNFQGMHDTRYMFHDKEIFSRIENASSFFATEWTAWSKFGFNSMSSCFRNILAVVDRFLKCFGTKPF